VSRHDDGNVQLGHLQYLPLSPVLFALLAGIYLAVVALIQVGILRYAYLRLGIAPEAVLVLLLGSLLGSYFNIPLFELPAERFLAQREYDYFGLRYVVPVEVDWPGTMLAINVGGALIPGMVSLYLLIKNSLWILGIIATACVAAVVHRLAYPMRGFGIAVPLLVPALTAGIVAMILSRRHPAALAYIAGSMGTLIGADLLNLGAIRRMGAPVASIGGAGTFDGVFLTGIIAVLIASLSGGVRSARTTVR